MFKRAEERGEERERETLETHAHSKAAVFEFLPDVWADAQSECKDESKQAQ